MQRDSSSLSLSIKAIKSDPLPLIVPLVFTAAIAVCLLLCIGQIKKAALGRAENILRDSAYEQVSLFKNSLRTQELFLNFLKYQVETGSINKDNLVKEITSASKASDMEHIAAATPDGVLCEINNEHFSIADRSYFKKAMHGDKNISYIETSKKTGKPYIVIAVPCMAENGSVKYVLCGYYSAEALQNLIIAQAFGGKAYSYIADTGGKVIIGSSNNSFLLSEERDTRHAYNNNIFSLLGSAHLEDTSLADIINETGQGRESSSYFKIKDSKRFAYYVPTGINGWFLINVVPDSVIKAETGSSARTALMLVTAVLILGLLYIVYVLKRESIMRRKIEDEKEQIKLHEQEYRIAAAHSDSVIFRYCITTGEIAMTPEAAEKTGLSEKVNNVPESLLENNMIHEDSKEDFRAFYRAITSGTANVSTTLKAVPLGGKPQWLRMDSTLILDANDKPAYAIITSRNVTEQREREIAGELWSQSMAKLSREKSMIIEYNITRGRTDKVTGSMKLRLRNIPDGRDFNTITKIWAEHNVYKDDRDMYIKFVDISRLLSHFYSGQTEDEALDFRGYTDKSEGWRWLRTSVKLARYPDNDDIKVFIIVTDIHDEKIRELEMEALSKQDSLTGVLNRKTFTDEVSLTLESDAAAHHALIMVDLDDFKIINDTFGHIAGDKIIINAAEIFKSQLRSGDLIGRMGGDEFMLQLKNVTGAETVRKRAEALSEMLKIEIVKGARSSASMGIAFYPEDGVTFDELYANVDMALYRSKKSKGTFAFCSSADRERTCRVKLNDTDY